jgi:hypothetical protein
VQGREHSGRMNGVLEGWMWWSVDEFHRLWEAVQLAHAMCNHPGASCKGGLLGVRYHNSVCVCVILHAVDLKSLALINQMPFSRLLCSLNLGCLSLVECGGRWMNYVRM